jgi:formamidopyrimidine-DNA glycosylase
VPELPEVETTRRGIAPHVEGRHVARVHIRQRQLRWPVPERLELDWPGQVIEQVQRRAKYLLFRSPNGTAMLHLGMSGSLRVLSEERPPGPHDHVDIEMAGGPTLRFNDPRRFGSLLWTDEPLDQHPLLRHLGPEPLGPAFDGDWLYRLSRGRRVAIKSFIMNAAVVVGVGNIYASEALFRAAIHPTRPAGRVSRARYGHLAVQIREVLELAIVQGGTTLKDFVDSSGQPGYFAQQLRVYDREGRPCACCGGPIRRRVVGQRSTYFCPSCQR